MGGGAISRQLSAVSPGVQFFDVTTKLDTYRSGTQKLDTKLDSEIGQVFVLSELVNENKLQKAISYQPSAVSKADSQ